MALVEFPCWTNFGKCDSADWSIEVELTDEEYSLLASVIESEPQEDFYKCGILSDIFQRVYDMAVNEATADALSYDDDLREKYGNDPSWKANMLYSIGVEYPEL